MAAIAITVWHVIRCQLRVRRETGDRAKSQARLPGVPIWWSRALRHRFLDMRLRWMTKSGATVRLRVGVKNRVKDGITMSQIETLTKLRRNL
jgi:hypothetical protein